MTLRLTQKIVLLKCGKIPTGYKKTEFGTFPCDWETDKRLKDIGVFGKGKGLPGEKMVSSGVPCVGYGDIYMKYNYHFEEAQSFVDEETASESQPIEKGTLLFTGTGETAEEIGKCVCYNGDETIYAGGDIITFVSKEVNPLFLAYQQYQDFSIRKKDGFGQGHSVVHIQRENLEKLPVAFPKSLSKQAKIAEILMTWDKAIELYKKQIEKLKQFKKICLKKMFPAKGQTVPEWRFKGFTDEWEKRKLGNFLREFSNKTTIEDEFPVLSSTNSGMESRIGRVSGESNIGYKIVENNDVVLSPQNLWLGNINVNTIGKGIVSPSYKTFKVVGIDIAFIEPQLRVDRMLNAYKNASTQGASVVRRNLEMELFYDIELLAPDIKEQQEIGHFFSSINKLIVLYQQKLEVEQKRRKALMQLLLTGIVRVE